MALSEALAILAAFGAKRLTLATLRSPEAVHRRQNRLLCRQLDAMAKTIPFYRPFAGRPFNEWPVMDKAASLAHFGALNAHGVSAEQAWAAAEAGLRNANGSGTIGPLTVGTSSGTSGNRGLFLVSPRERHLWLGSILARTLPDFPWRRHRVAVLLATANGLYDTTQASGRLAFAFFDIRRGVAPLLPGLQRFAPDTIVAPPSALRVLAETGRALPLKTIFAGGEVLDDLDANAIQQAFGVRPRSLYQATEGFLGVACAYGRIHLNEDDMLFEREAVPGHPGRFVPVITDLRRTSQAMIRYRLNDVLVLGRTPCACGSPLLALERVEGRRDDTLLLPTRSGMVEIMPDAVRTAILDSDRGIRDFRVVQTGAGEIALALSGPAGSHDGAAAALRQVFDGHGVVPEVSITRGRIEHDLSRKMRRIARLPAVPRQGHVASKPM